MSLGGTMMNWTSNQMMAVALARQIEDGKSYIVGTGLPLVGATLAKNTFAPNAHLIFETALFEGNPQELPTSVSDLRINTRLRSYGLNTGISVFRRSQRKEVLSTAAFWAARRSTPTGI